jgi:uncharacterized membrane protein
MEALGLGLTALATAIESICVSALFLGSGVMVIIGLLLFTKTFTLKDIIKKEVESINCNLVCIDTKVGVLNDCIPFSCLLLITV